MNKLYLITGPAGVGKSTISNKLANSLNKSVLIEGDEIYHMVKGGYVSPWLEGNHLEVFWKNIVSLISNSLNSGYDVVFNYIINETDLDFLKSQFESYEIHFILLMTSETELLRRDKTRPIDCRMNERCLVLLNQFKKIKSFKNYVLDTSNLTLDETLLKVLENNFIIR